MEKTNKETLQKAVVVWSGVDDEANEHGGNYIVSLSRPFKEDAYMALMDLIKRHFRLKYIKILSIIWLDE